MILYQKVIEEYAAVWQSATHTPPPLKWVKMRNAEWSNALSRDNTCCQLPGKIYLFKLFYISIFYLFIWLFYWNGRWHSGRSANSTRRSQGRERANAVKRCVLGVEFSLSASASKVSFFSIWDSFHNCAIISSPTISMPSAKVTKSEAESLFRLQNLMESHTT